MLQDVIDQMITDIVLWKNKLRFNLEEIICIHHAEGNKMKSETRKLRMVNLLTAYKVDIFTFFLNTGVIGRIK